jgi:nucleotide-binding universal stress UspA family protein
MAMERVLVPLDGSPLAREAIPFAAYISRRMGGQLHLLRVHPGWNTQFVGNASALRIGDARRKEEHAQAAQELAEVAQELQNEEIPTTSSIRVGEAGPEILEALEEQQIDLLVMSTHGRSGVQRALFGSVAEYVIHAAHIPILLIPPECAVDWRMRERLRILVTLDSSSYAEAILPSANAMARQLRSELELLQVVEPRERPGERMEAERYLQRTASGYRVPTGVQAHVVEGTPAEAIAAYAREKEIDLIAMATHGHRGLARLVMGSVTSATLQQAHLPILVVRPNGLASSAEIQNPEAELETARPSRTADV